MKNNKAKQLVLVLQYIQRLKQKEMILREKLLALMEPNEEIEVGKWVVVKKVVKEAITDPQMLQQIGIDPSKVTVTVTKIDPVLVREIGKKENKPYYKEVERIYVKRKGSA